MICLSDDSRMISNTGKSRRRYLDQIAIYHSYHKTPGLRMMERHGEEKVRKKSFIPGG